MRTSTIRESDFIGTETYRLADGSAVSSRTFIIRSLTVGDRTVTDVRASIADGLFVTFARYVVGRNVDRKA